MLNIALVGLGHWGRKYFKLLSEMEGINFVACADINRERHSVDSSKQSKVSFYIDYKEMLQSVSLDGVVIATPASTHYSIAKNILELGINLLIEKPMTTSSKSAEELMRIAADRNKIVMVGHTFLFDENFKNFKKKFVLGPEVKFDFIKSTRIHSGLEREDVSCVWDLMPHDLSIINDLIKHRPLSIKAFPLATCLKTKRIGMASVYLNYENELKVEIELGWLGNQKIRKLELQNINKKIECLYYPQFKVTMNEKTEILESETEPLQVQLEFFFNSIKNKICLRSSGIDALEIVSLVELADRSIQNNGSEFLLD